jgi:L-malate glycosyltransferase
MKLGFASPVSLQLLRHLVAYGDELPPGYQFAPAADWVLELMRRGHHVYLYTTSREIDEPRTFCGDGLTIRIASQRPRGTGRDFFAAERDQLRQLMIADECQIIHAHWTYQFALAALASGIPTLVTIHDLPWKVLAHFRDFHRVARLLMAYTVAQRGLHFTAVSRDAASHFRRYLAPGADITVIPNGLPNALFEMGEQSKRPGGGAPVFATVLQGWSRLKNGEAALRAFHILRRQVPEALLQMYGNDYEIGGPAYRWALRHGIADAVTFKGPLPYSELLKSISLNVDVVVHPSLNEAFSMTGLEALALRKVFVAGKATSGMKEMLDFSACGVLVDVTDPQAIAAEMLRLAQDGSYRDRIAQCGYDRASSRYRLGTVMSQYESLYSRILQARPAAIGAFRSAT